MSSLHEAFGPLILCAVGLAAAPVHSADFEAGVTRITVSAPERVAPLAVTVWYPADAGGEAVTLGENVFFEGTGAYRDADMSAGTFTLILLSHGAGLAGRAEAMSWIAAPLARKGYVVAAPTHPGNTGPDRSARETMKLWLRPSDLSATLDATVADPGLGPLIDAKRVGVLGLSMGGNSALLLAGARLDPALYGGFCDDIATNPSLCGWLKQSGVDLRDMDLNAAARDNLDTRIRAVVAIDPAPADIFDTESLGRIGVPVTVVNLGPAADRPATLEASQIAAAMPRGAYQVIEGAQHASMFPLCKPGAAQIAVDEGIEDTICEAPERSRADIHAHLITLVADAFAGDLTQR